MSGKHVDIEWFGVLLSLGLFVAALHGVLDDNWLAAAGFGLMSAAGLWGHIDFGDDDDDKLIGV